MFVPLPQQQAVRQKQFILISVGNVTAGKLKKMS
jgi:hypothetical protein